MRANRKVTPYLFVLPALAVFTFAVVVPFVLTFYYSFLDWNGYGEQTWRGLGNYSRLTRDAIFLTSFRNVLAYIAATLVVEVLAGLILAGLIHAQRRGTLVFRVVFFIPVLLPMVVIAVLWSFVYNPDIGLINDTLANIGLSGWQHIWLGDPNTALWAITVVSGWIFSGFFMVIFYAAFTQIPSDVIEAARLDGAGEWSIFWRVKVPMITSSIRVAALLCITGGLQSFDLFYVMTNGGPYHATEIPTTYIVRTVFHNQQVGYGSAMSVALTFVVVLVAGAFALLGRRRRVV